VCIDAARRWRVSESDLAGKASLPESAVEASRARREALHAAVDDLERGVAAFESEPDRERFAATMRDVLRTVHQHVDDVESPGGLLDEMATVAPRVSYRVEKLRREHADLLERTRSLLRRAEDDDALETLATEGRALSEDLTAHRHRGTELMQDVFLTDIPAAD
jgi:phage shock protein A